MIPILGRALLLAAFALLGCASARAQSCLEPSALDLDSSAPPLRVAKAPSGLAMTWQDAGAPGYHVHEGSLQAFDSPAVYDHVVVADPVAPSIVLSEPPGDRYFLVNAECSFGQGSTGRDSFGRERPPGGQVLVTVGIEGGAGVFAALVGVAHPSWTTLADPDMVFLGPLAPGSPGDPLTAVNNDPAGVVTVAASFQVFDPDPSFTPPAGSPVPFASMLFTFYGTTPAPADIPIVECDVRDALADTVPGAACGVIGFESSR